MEEDTTTATFVGSLHYSNLAALFWRWSLSSQTVSGRSHGGQSMLMEWSGGVVFPATEIWLRW